MVTKTTLEFFGTTTFRLKWKGLTIFHDTWLDKPEGLKRYLELKDVTELDYIVISHAHFDHLPGADQLAVRTGATIIANGEAIRCLRDAGVPDAQLIPVSGGERVPLFSKETLRKAAEGLIDRAPAPPTAPPMPHVKYAAAAVHVWPSLHSLIPAITPQDLPEEFDTAERFTGEVTPYDCTLDITRLMQFGLFRMKEFMPEETMDPGTRAFADYVQDRRKHVMSHFDGGQLMYNFVADGKSILFNSHLGVYQGIAECVIPKPTVAIMGAGGRANLDGRPFQGSAAEFLVKQAKWLSEPTSIYFCLHDPSIIKPLRVDVNAAKQMLQQETAATVIDTLLGKVYTLDV
ncbi:uncharacterized protein FFB20_14630 [Fusarium fujikuroi]|uniref:Metallo-beta-lactamase domain-containing protein n=2 Tax=Fusarium fujikuroi TaxID=5127 RepID=S0E1P7_GIBF5|nr:uncharacterized protein FFUJ_03623 [Fusarium fujikuroi IMI 58289]KLP17262.1 uncharacterized protein LW94_517 [Fusarium fujikuroi]QGI62764.1 hypothetical protein CEK27_006735 [Fusarium fujikuroi]QGI79933.1 hypothetical protein CEK25_006662 [Fusarium fujikuroi]QGI93654.1 hypothetical protein CEK26_006723 [Fusarium fujikuroi]CCT66583.1 uncharacterized protein FFUJ_03623 [Fusarium fujikuroi IMI 58289]